MLTCNETIHACIIRVYTFVKSELGCTDPTTYNISHCNGSILY